MSLFKRKKKRGRPKQNKGILFSKPRRTEEELKEIREGRIRRLFTWVRLFFFFLFLAIVYAIASLFSFWTGRVGVEIQTSLTTRAGGAVLIVLLFMGYICFSILLRRKIYRILAQTLATLFLFTSAALVLGLFSRFVLQPHWTLLKPGFFGQNLAQFFMVNVGFFGTMLFCIASILTSLVLYGIISTQNILTAWEAMSLKIKGFELHRKKLLESKEDTPISRATLAAEKTENMCDQQTNPKTISTDEILETSKENSKSEVKHQIIQEREIVKKQEGEEEGEEPSLKSVFQESQAEEAPARIIMDETDSTGAEGETMPEINLPTPEKGEEESIVEGVFPPPLDLFGTPEPAFQDRGEEKAKEQSEAIISTLADFDVQAELAEIVIGPTVIQFQIQLAPGIKVSKIAGLANDLAVALAVPALRVEAPIPGKPYVGIEIPNPKRRGVSLRKVLDSQAFEQADYALPLPMGVRVDSRPLIIGLEDLPHLLVAGTTGSGKSVFVNSCIAGLCYCRRPEELRFLMIDPKRVELSIYEHLPHILAKPVVSPKKAIQALAWAVREMEHRYDIFARARVRNLAGYNEKVLPKDKLPHIVIVVDELADLMFTAQKEVEDYICRLAQMARATGIHLMLATQRPSVNVVTGLIKANIPARVAFTLPSQADSRTIIDVSGAEKLLGKGDMLFVSPRYPRPVRLQSPFIEDGKSMEVVTYMKNLFGEPEYIDIEEQGESGGNGVDAAFTDDPLLEEAMQIVLDTGIASASRLQRQLRIGFTRAARLIDTMEQLGIVGPPDGSKPREILVDETRAQEIMDEHVE